MYMHARAGARDVWLKNGKRSLRSVGPPIEEIRYSSRTRAGTDQFKHVQKMRRAVAGLLEQLPEKLKDSPEAIGLVLPAPMSTTLFI